MPDDYRLRRIAPEDRVAASRSAKSSPNTIANDAAAVEDILRRVLSPPSSSTPPTTTNGHQQQQRAPTSPPAAPGDADLRAQLAALQKQHADAISALDQGRIAFQNLEAKHQQFVDANVAFTHWRDDMERQRASWADANAKFAKRHEEHKAARANLEAKYHAVLADLEEMKERYGRTKRELASVTGQQPPPSPPLPSARPAGEGAQVRPAGRKMGSASAPGAAAGGGGGSSRSVRGVERSVAPPPHPAATTATIAASGYPQQLVEQSMLRERLTSDMFTLSQKVLEERASRAEEARQMAERRIFELESQLAGHHPPPMSPAAPTPFPPANPYRAVPPLHHRTLPPLQHHHVRSESAPTPPPQSLRRGRDRMMDVDSLVSEDGSGGSGKRKRRKSDDHHTQQQQQQGGGAGVELPPLSAAVGRVAPPPPP